MTKPVLMPRHLGVGLDAVQDAGRAKARLGVDDLVQALPLAQRFDDQRQLARIATLLADPTPIAARLLAGDLALLAQGHRHAALGEMKGGTGADYAAADDHDVRLRRRRGIERYRVEFRSHGSATRARANAHKLSSGVELTGMTAMLAVLGRSRTKATMRARSSGWVILSGGRSVTAALMSETTKPGQTATARTPSSQPAWRTAWVRARAANLLTE